MQDDLVLRIPEPAMFATNPGEALGPRDSGGPSYATLAAGWQVGTRPPARWMNWLQKVAGRYQRAALAGALSDWTKSPTTIATVNPDAMIYHPSPGSGHPGLFAAYGSTSVAMRSYDQGRTWSAEYDIGTSGNIYPHGIAIDPTQVLVGKEGEILYKNSIDWAGASYAVEAVGFAGSEDVTAIATRYRDGSPTTWAGSLGGDVRRRLNGLGGAGTWADSAPSPKGSLDHDGSGIRSLVYVGSTGSTLLALTEQGQIWRTTDASGAMGWSLLATLIGAGGLQSFRHMARCPHTGSIVVLRHDTGGYRLPQYSHDGGLTWTEASFPDDPAVVGSGTAWLGLKTAGGGAFVASGQGIVNGATVWRSVDRGATWRRVVLQDAAVNGGVMACDGQRVYLNAATVNEDLWLSRALDGGAL